MNNSFNSTAPEELDKEIDGSELLREDWRKPTIDLEDDGSELLRGDWRKPTEEDLQKFDEEEREMLKEIGLDYPEEKEHKKPSDKDENGYEMKIVPTREDEIERLKKLREEYEKMQERDHNQGMSM